ncbi:phosphotransferase [Stutzerimonas kirkiae]|uniref:Aminoglycoside phosphotransferase n=1 Tax=Stutzerimonas kirkiae TaxID=2211392 RepID=A0A4Q9REZ6_9GAMM|nr:phosphotransferase [Stutzerimonas kirkiae]TBU98881.1 aminoglycoside phosphotransferase [Stutzerimonas kirkiae]TBV03975.1 aminoglycoside phosphotransferase [Stutzerimonas kirkiae]TBV09614.1 aminoglycoside phosphotransferase [Stutzerimonas kirkiae]
MLSSPLERLNDCLGTLGFAAASEPVEVTAAVASPLRLATEWQGYAFECQGARYHAKVLFDDTAAWIDVPASARASQLFAASGVTPELVAQAPQQGVLVFAALPEGSRWSRVDDLLSAERLTQLFAAKKALHACPAAPLGRTPLETLDWLRRRCVQDRVLLPEDAAWIDQCIDLVRAALTRSGWRVTPIHGDGVASNVILAGERLMLVDFDRSSLFDPWYDLAATLNELYQFEDQWRLGIELWNGACREPDYARCRLHALLDDWIWTLWGLWAGSVTQREVEFSKVGQWTLLRLRDGLADPRFESWLRLL